MKYFNKTVEKNFVNAPLIDEISSYVESILNKHIPQISYNGYIQFYKNGSRKEFEKEYFERRKQLTALGLYLQWNDSREALEYFQELLWIISNEFSWCLVAHLSYDEDDFKYEPDKIIDLFSAETAEALCEILIIHEDKIDKLLNNHIRKQIEHRVILPFINKKWQWETATHNWSAVCSGCIGIIALLIEKEERQRLILDKVEKALDYYIKGFGDDGASLEGIGYWSYGFGYYIYYKALKNEIYLQESNKNIRKIQAIANFPEKIQITENIFLPFSDVPPSMILPSGLISYLHDKYGIKIPSIEKISSLDFDHCYRWAHVSRNLWWTNENILNKKLTSTLSYFKDAQWMISRKDNMFFAIKGGSNYEPHNHNDVGNFVAAINGEMILIDLGAGIYTKGYFGSERYTYTNTRSYWHSVPVINGFEQEEQEEKSNVIKSQISDENINFELELASSYPTAQIEKFYRKVNFKNNRWTFVIEDTITSKHEILINEGFVSYIEPRLISEGEIIWKGINGSIRLSYDSTKLDYLIEKKEIIDHYNQPVTIYRLGLITINKNKLSTMSFQFHFQ